MDRGRLRELLEEHRTGEQTTEQVVEALTGEPGARIPDAHIDLQRRLRTGHPEIIYGEHKTAAQIIAILSRLREAGQDGLATRVKTDTARIVRAALPEVQWHETARILQLPSGPASPLPEGAPRIAVVCAGTSDLPVAEEAAVTAEALGHRVDRYVDIGVAGLHRLLSRLDELRRADVLIVVAGMEGALPSVVAGLLPQPIVAVPTSIGYGASFGGVAALLGMLSSCASGVSVVNIDNGFGAALFASRILRQNTP
jgi:NCAIR mutase (PurE)-related protein